MKQNQRKNNTRRALEFPTTTYFTIRDVVQLNPQMRTVSESDITIRVRLSNAIGEGKVAEIGSVPGGKGRPQKVFSMTPVTQTTLNKAKQDGINLADGAEKLVNVVSVTTPSAPTNLTATQSPVPVTN